MCGIAGIIAHSGHNGPPPSREDIEPFLNSLKSRGPDHQDVWVGPDLVFAHTRLKIIDLSDLANQPFKSKDSKVVLVFNGEIYNYQELRAELKTHSYEFRTTSDTEVLLNAYLHWGEDVFRRLNGMFAFGIWDNRAERKFYLVRDRFGIKPVYFSSNEKRTVFSSTLGGFLKSPLVNKEIDETSLSHFLKFSHVSVGRSILKSVESLEPGNFLKIEKGKITKHQYWNSLTERKKDIAHSLSFDETLNELEGIFRAVIKRQMVADVPVGLCLSGGIDSSLIASFAVELGFKPKTYTVAYHEKESNEGHAAKTVADVLGTEHHEIIVTPEEAVPVLWNMPEYFDEPFADPTLIPTLLLSQRVSKDLKVVMSGDGGDELFFGYPYQAVVRRLWILGHIPLPIRTAVFETLRSACVNPFVAPISSRIQQLGKMCEILQFKTESEMYEYFIGTIGPVRRDRLNACLTNKSVTYPPAIETLVKDLAGLDHGTKTLEVFLKTFLPGTVLTKTDRAMMAFGVESRVPFLDNELFEFAAKVPLEFHLRPGVTKYLLRSLARKRLPLSVARKPKQGFSVPWPTWLRGPLRFLIDEYLSESRLKSEGLFDHKIVREWVRAFLEKEANHSHLLFSLIQFQMWKERYRL